MFTFKSSTKWTFFKWQVSGDIDIRIMTWKWNGIRAEGDDVSLNLHIQEAGNSK